MSGTLPEQFLADRREITARLMARRGRRRLSDGETWIDHRCLFHDDAHESASWQAETGVYFCRTESKTFAVPLVMQALAMRESGPRPAVHGVASARSLPARDQPELPAAKFPKDKALAVAYRYTFPDGRLSHVKYRVGDGPRKNIWQEGPAGESSLPEQVWPIFQAPGLDHRSIHLLVVEGEKCVEIVHDADESYDTVPIRALTAGSVSDLKKHAALLAAYIRDLHPASVTVWPDNDEPGVRAAEEVSTQLLMLNVEHRVLDPGALGLPPKGDVVDFVLAGGRLSEQIRQGRLPQLNGSADGMVSRAIVTRDAHVVFPQTRNLVAINHDNAAAIWYHEAHGLPKDAQTKELATRLRVKSQIMPVEVRPRQHNTSTETWWRPRSTGAAVHISRSGVDLVDDPEGVFLYTPSDELSYPPDVDLDGSRADLEEMGSHFHLTPVELVMLEGWLCCAIAGLQTPILFMRAPAGTGKTTLARLLLGVIEPLCPELDLSKRANQDMRELITVLRSTQALLIDNVSKLDGGLEDQLAKMVTGYTTALRPLYSDQVLTQRLRRALILTTTGYDVYKGDLAQRMIVAQPQTERELRWLPDSVATARFARFIPRIRGFVFHQVAEYYRQRESLEALPIAFRIGDLGLVLAGLGYDTNEMAELEAKAKSQIISQDNPWVESLVELWQQEDSVTFTISTADLLKYMADYGIKDLPPEKSSRLARFLNEKNPMFADFGFTVEKWRTASFKGFKFRRLSDVDRAESVDSLSLTE